MPNDRCCARLRLYDTLLGRHALVAAILHTAYMIEAAQYQVERNMDCRDAMELSSANPKQELPGPTIAAIVFAACNCGLLYYLTFCFMTDK